MSRTIRIWAECRPNVGRVEGSSRALSTTHPTLPTINCTNHYQEGKLVSFTALAYGEDIGCWSVDIWTCCTGMDFWLRALQWPLHRVRGNKTKKNRSIRKKEVSVLPQTSICLYGLLTKCEVKMAGYWPRSFFACLWTETKSRSINSQKKNEANIQPSWPNKLGR